MGKSLEWLKSKVDDVTCDKKLFKTILEDEAYVIGVVGGQTQKPDYYSISFLYDSIIDIFEKIKYSFFKVVDCNPSESLNEYNAYGELPTNENNALYYIENMVFRSIILWNLLAQLCNQFWKVNEPIRSVKTEKYFREQRSKHELADQIVTYFNEKDRVLGETEFWGGNHRFVRNYRNKMAHWYSPNISGFSSIAVEQRPPAMFVLKRVTEDFIEAWHFITMILKDITASFSNFDPIDYILDLV